MSVEQHLRQTLHRADAYVPSPDLFARVQRSIEEDRAHRRRVRLMLTMLMAGGAVVAVYLVLLGDLDAGRPTWPWWALELLVTVVLGACVIVLGPLIRRFGRIYAAAVFVAHPPTAGRFLALLDVAYYLVFASYVLLTTTIAPDTAWLGTQGLAEQLGHLSDRVGGMLLLMGLLHSLTIVLLPVLGLVFSDAWRRRPADG
jgi:hypothetical protein